MCGGSIKKSYFSVLSTINKMTDFEFEYPSYGLRNRYGSDKLGRPDQEFNYYLLHIGVSILVTVPNLFLFITLMSKSGTGNMRPLDKILLNYTINGILWGVFGHSLFTHTYFFNWSFGIIACRIYHTLMVAFDFAFQFHMFVVSVDRVLQAISPYRYLQRVNSVGCGILLAFPWVSTILVTLPIYFVGFASNSTTPSLALVPVTTITNGYPDAVTDMSLPAPNPVCSSALIPPANRAFHLFTFIICLFTVASTFIVIYFLLKSRGLQSYRLLTSVDRRSIRSSLTAGIVVNLMFAATMFVLKCFHQHIMDNGYRQHDERFWIALDVFAYLAVSSAGIIPVLWFVDSDVRKALYTLYRRIVPEPSEESKLASKSKRDSFELIND